MPSLDHINTRYMLDYVARRAAEQPSLRVLDFGCGGGEVVGGLRDKGIDAYGADVFYSGSNFRAEMGGDLFREGRMRVIGDDGRLPFEENSFDLVVSDQVLEHVEDLETATREMYRVLGPDGIAYHQFPSREVLREGHIGIPLAHRLPTGAARHRYATFMRRLGRGFYRDSRPPDVWATESLAWIDSYTTYRPYRQIRCIMDPYFDVEHREIEYCRFRAGQRGVVRAFLDLKPLEGLSERLFRRLAFMALELRPRLQVYNKGNAHPGHRQRRHIT
jgi:SAM-dependent methyltransferase